MDAFENIVAGLLEDEGYWVRTSVKVILTKAEKRKIGKASSPRWELDIVAYKAETNEILVVECKSSLDSRGVRYDSLVEPDRDRPNRYKLFNETKLRKVVFNRLVRQLLEKGSCRKNPKVKLCLAAGKIASVADHDNLNAHFVKNGWQLFDQDWLRSRLERTVEGGYENSVAVVVAKLLHRDQPQNSK